MSHVTCPVLILFANKMRILHDDWIVLLHSIYTQLISSTTIRISVLAFPIYFFNISSRIFLLVKDNEKNEGIRMIFITEFAGNVRLKMKEKKADFVVAISNVVFILLILYFTQ